MNLTVGLRASIFARYKMAECEKIFQTSGNVELATRRSQATFLSPNTPSRLPCVFHHDGAGRARSVALEAEGVRRE